MLYSCDEAEYVKKLIRLLPLVLGICIAAFILTFTNNIVSLYHNLGFPQADTLDVYFHAFFLLAIIFFLDALIVRVDSFRDGDSNYLIAKMSSLLQHLESYNHKRFYELSL